MSAHHRVVDPADLSDEELDEELTIAAVADDQDAVDDERFDQLLTEYDIRSEDDDDGEDDDE